MKQKGFLLAAGFSLAFVLTFSCSGDDGTDGKHGVDGASCDVSQVAEGTQVTCGENVVIIPNGTDGTNGKDGDNGTGTKGSDGKSCEAEQSNDGIITITCGESVVGIAFCGEENKFYNPINKLCDDGILKDIFIDSRDGKKYAYVEIGDYIWMAENLIYGKADGKYTWAEAVEACPTGWELPELSVIQDLVSADAFTLNLAISSNWWSKTDDDTENAYFMQTNTSGGFTQISFISIELKTIPYFVRCVKAN